MAETDPGIDPRYAAQFQRGYDGPVLVPPSTTAPSTTATHSTRTAPVRIEGGPPATASRVPDPPHVVARAHVDEEPVEGDEPEDSPRWTRPRTEWALLAAGLGLLIVAGVLFEGSIEIARLYQGVGPDWSDQIYAYSVGVLPGPMFLAGIVGICLWVALRAVHPEQRSG